MKKHFTLIVWVFFIACLSTLTAAKGYGKTLFESSLTPASSESFSPEVDAKIEISDTGKVELSIKGLQSLPDNQPVNQNSTLVIEAEINDNSQTFSESFDISNGDAELEFNLEGVNPNDKLEIISVAVNRGITPGATPTISPTGSPSATPTVVATITPEVTPVATPTEVPTATPITTPTATPTEGDVILVPGGLISEATTPTPTVTPTSTPGGAVTANVDINPNTINVRNRGRFRAIIRLSSPHNVNDIVTETVEAEGASAIRGNVRGNRFIATFRTRDLDLTQNGNGGRREITVSGELEDGTRFEGTDTVRIVGRDDDDDDDDNNGY